MSIQIQAPPTAVASATATCIPRTCGEPFELFLKTGDEHYWVAFGVRGFRHEVPTRCTDRRDAVMVARVAYVSVGRTVARLTPHGMRAWARSMRMSASGRMPSPGKHGRMLRQGPTVSDLTEVL